MPDNENHPSGVLLCGCPCGTLWCLTLFWWRIFHEACQHESRVFHKNIADRNCPEWTNRRNPAPVGLCCSCRFHVFWMAGQIIIRVLVSSLVPQVSKPEHVSGNTWWGAKGTGKWLGLESAEKVLRVVTVLCFCLGAGSGKVPACGERDGHAAVHPVSHAGESTTSGVQSECRDPHQTGPVLGAGRHPQAAGNHSRFLPPLFFVKNYCVYREQLLILLYMFWFWHGKSTNTP